MTISIRVSYWKKTVGKPRTAPENALTLIGNEELLKNLWEKTLRDGMESMEGFVCTINTVFHAQLDFHQRLPNS
ncbi:MAG: hypothetical protein J7L76_02615 [Spirochaetaceae bacterium]|nr:hypothetical protein [Spirochaetaceae bacterium]